MSSNHTSTFISFISSILKTKRKSKKSKKSKERKGKERKGKERKGKERKGKSEIRTHGTISSSDFKSDAIDPSAIFP
jgi:hypothetical protein